jgi:hypothetical protein
MKDNVKLSFFGIGVGNLLTFFESRNRWNFNLAEPILLYIADYLVENKCIVGQRELL